MSELTFAILSLSQQDLTKLMASFGRDPEHFSPPCLPCCFSSLLSLPLLWCHCMVPSPSWGQVEHFFQLQREKAQPRRTPCRSPVCATCGDRAHAHSLVLLSHHMEHPEGAGVRASLPALQQPAGSQARRLVHQASLGIRGMSNKPFLRLAFRNHAFILSVVMVLH